MQTQHQLIQRNFNQAATSYMAHANIQKVSAAKIINSMTKHYKDGFILDLGSGPGTLAHQANNNYPVILYDLSLAMLKAGVNLPNSCITAINGDATHLPFASNSIDTVISNLMLQWPENKPQVFKEIQRVLAPSGHIIFTTLIKPSLWQLQNAWNQIDNAKHTLDFLTLDDYVTLCQNSGLNVIKLQTWESQLEFNDIYTLLRHFKLTGTSMPKSKHGNSLIGVGLIEKLSRAYPKLESETQYRLNYNYLMLIAYKEFNT